MDNKKQSLKIIFSEALEHYKKRDFKAAEVYCYKILNINPNHFDSLSLLANIFAEIETVSEPLVPIVFCITLAIHLTIN